MIQQNVWSIRVYLISTPYYNIYFWKSSYLWTYVDMIYSRCDIGHLEQIDLRTGRNSVNPVAIVHPPMIYWIIVGERH